MSESYKAYDLALFFDLSADLLCISGFDGYFRRVNPTFENILGYSHEELLSRPIDDFIHPDDRPLTNLHRESLRNGLPLLNFENRYISRSGEIIWLSWTSMPALEKGLVYAIAKQISHRKLLEADRNQLLSNLTKINGELKQLTYTTSHDLRAPVNNLVSIFSLLDPAKIPDPETRQYIDLLKFSTQVLQENLNRHVDLISRQDNLTNQLELVSPGEVLADVMQALHALVQQSNASFEIDFSACGLVRFNRDLLESIFLNLISNAIKYARPDSFPKISISTESFAGATRLRFSDQGLGFDLPNMRDKLFGLRQTFHDHSDSKGIGLYLVHSHVTSLGGRIDVDSRPNEGTTFIITFPD